MQRIEDIAPRGWEPSRLGTEEQAGILVDGLDWRHACTEDNIDVPYLVELNDSIEDVLGMLERRDGGTLVSIIGMGGIGKTTLARKVYRHYKQQKKSPPTFTAFAWVGVSQQFTRKRVWKGVLEQLLMESPKERQAIAFLEGDTIATKLYNFLKENACLVVLDDIWDINDWRSLCAGFPVGPTKGTKIVITTRRNDILGVSDDKHSLHECRYLYEEESWRLFENIAIKGRDDIDAVNERIKKLGRKMLERCGNLPLAITVLAGLLKTKDNMSDWEKVNGNMDECLGRGEGNEKGNLGVREVLRLSYTDLPHQLKPCFLHLGHFPEDSGISVKKLVRIWVVEGFARRRGNDTAEDVAKGYVKELASRCMVEVAKRSSTNGAIKTCRLHDVMRKFCLAEAQDQRFFERVGVKLINDSSDNDPCANTIQLSLSTSQAEMQHPHFVQEYRVCRAAMYFDVIFNNDDKKDGIKGGYSSLRSLLYFSTQEYLKPVDATKLFKFTFNSLKLLRVLDFDGVHVYGGKMPEEIGHLIHLRYLSLRGSNVQGLPSSICNLRCLQVLDIRSATKMLVVIPEHFISKMVDLRHLYLPESYCMEGAAAAGTWDFTKLVNLQTLVNVSGTQVCNLEGVAKVLRDLKKLVIQGMDHTANLQNIFNSTNRSLLESLTLICSIDDREKVGVTPLVNICPRLQKMSVWGGIQRLPDFCNICPNLIKVTLEQTFLEQDLMEILGKLDSLKILHLLKNPVIVDRMECAKGSFRVLERLFLCGLLYLEEWELKEGSMLQLKDFAIESCRRLREIPKRLERLGAMSA